ncbi:flagellar basal body rod C-terminal domain-containing protein [Buchnera aphidicola]|uniref:Flagellar basal-body rod protein FlgF n=1 Tax=Buchnera aphidicola subsp. Tuberolachnus salignus TaxID=98804 RepID=A0A160SWW0_BUCTT|nr:flagellar basal body rod C-terminal domain-containing protein [Buchnera aphidicola]CUR53200.1 Flagellar basal-body rod protein FlgF [Buchnera aphidicola (Tuberolachnus salignus)]
MNKTLKTILQSANNNLQKQKIFSNNIANISTPGFKEQYVYQVQKKNHNKDIQNVNQVFVNLKRGNFKKIDNSKYLTTKKNNWIAVLDTDLDIAFMQTGKLELNKKGELLLNKLPILNVNDETIISPTHKMPKILSDGKVVLNFKKNNKLSQKFLGQIKVLKFLPEDLLYINHGKYFLKDTGMIKYTQNQLRRFGIDTPEITDELEESNVNITENLINMMASVRNFESNMKTISTEQENEEKSNTLLNGVL